MVTVALNMMCHGMDSGLDFTHIMQVRESYERFTGMKVHERTPYAGDLVFTAFSGSRPSFQEAAVTLAVRQRSPGSLLAKPGR